ncbi:MAG: dTMP kinase [Lachnospiraceae bacterium]|nr:dTMP kinase [Lachnospiraceae bacterium]
MTNQDRTAHPDAVFVALEGIDGSGKSTQLKLLGEYLEAKGVPVFLTREPTDAPIGKLLRQVLRGEVKSDYRAIAPLFAADRLHHITVGDGTDGESLLGKLSRGISVLTDRYYFSSYAYHSVDVPMDWVIECNREAADLLRPDLTVFIDVSPETAMARITAGRDSTELFETKERLSLVREKYLEAFARLSGEEKVLVVDGNRPPEEISAEICAAVGSLR